MMTTTPNRNVTEIETYTGQYVDLLNPKPSTICIEDIAVHLSNICRFNGAVSKPYSVAEHAVRVSKIVQREAPMWPEEQLLALHHDSAEAYTGDITAPLKRVFEQLSPGTLKDIERGLDEVIREALVLPEPNEFELRMIKAADDEALFREAAALKYSHGRGDHWGNDKYHRPYAGIGWSPEKAEREFLKRHYQLERKR